MISFGVGLVNWVWGHRDAIKESEDSKKIQLSANAVLGTHFSNNKHKKFNEICSEIRITYADCPLLENLVNHAMFPVYITKRIHELSAKKLEIYVYHAICKHDEIGLIENN